jgi:chorismate lyase / 3-hydroxybenzoate synthase
VATNFVLVESHVMTERILAQLVPGRAEVAGAIGGRGPAPAVPAWASEAVGLDGRAAQVRGPVCVHQGVRGALLTVVLPDAVRDSAAELEERVVEGYASIAGVFGSGFGAGLHPVRFWNFIPGIHDEMGPGGGAGSPAVLSRYMAFNGGRFRAFEAFRELDPTGGAGARRGVATATGVGYGGTDLVIHCLAWPTPGAPIENPRQVPAYRYSPRYGPHPPCFARGTLVDRSGGPMLLVGGTASVVGEASVHVSGAETDLVAQVDETLANLTALIAAGIAAGLIEGNHRAEGSHEDNRGPRRVLDRLTDVRVYHLRVADRPALARVLAERLSRATRVEFVRGDICRPELLVEIEGVADVGASAASGR